MLMWFLPHISQTSFVNVASQCYAVVSHCFDDFLLLHCNVVKPCRPIQTASTRPCRAPLGSASNSPAKQSCGNLLASICC